MPGNTKSITQEWVYRSVGDRIREERRKLRPKLRQEDLAAAIGMNRASIAKIEAGTQRFTLDTLYEIAKRLGLEPSSLLPKLANFGCELETDRSILETARSPEGLHDEEIHSILRALKKVKKK